MGLQQMLSHRPLHPDSPAFKTFLTKIAAEIDTLQKCYPQLDFNEERRRFTQLESYEQ